MQVGPSRVAPGVWARRLRSGLCFYLPLDWEEYYVNHSCQPVG